MKPPPVSLLLGVSVLLLLSGLTVSAVSLNVSPNLQQFFSGDSVSLSCAEDGQTVHGWTVKRTRGGQAEECGAAGSDFGRLDGSSCDLDLTKPFTAGYLCGTSSGQSSDQVTITVTDVPLILEIPALPVLTGSDVTLTCKKRNGDKVNAYFLINGKSFNGTVTFLEFTISNIQQSDEGLYSCATDVHGKSPQSRLRVRDPTTTSDPHTTTSSTTSDPHTTTALYTATAFNNTYDKASSSPLMFVISFMASCPYWICTIVMVMCCRKMGNKPVVSMDDEYDDITVDVITKPDLRATGQWRDERK
ncbi:hypothetical protein EXN66_Car014139 [Channa argus]|uniref:Ig-like domain-containing protein n=1 Tax=Channa argus TaxID=215402 RepID=A0A6G1Q855_CHAAH|nr:hypothetical protein EXN66_Car014139 [Channa argus]